jgi:hypothetical protein
MRPDVPPPVAHLAVDDGDGGEDIGAQLRRALAGQV